MVEEISSIVTSLSLKVTGKEIGLMEQAVVFSAMDKYMRANGLMVKWKAEESSSRKMVLPTLESGLAISSMAMDTKNGLMVQSMKATSQKE